MRTLVWLFRGLIFLLLLIFALKNQHVATVYGFLGSQWQAPMIVVVLAAFALGCVFGVLAMLPRWWRQRQRARATANPPPVSVSPPSQTSQAPMTHPPREIL